MSEASILRETAEKLLLMADALDGGLGDPANAFETKAAELGTTPQALYEAVQRGDDIKYPFADPSNPYDYQKEELWLKALDAQSTQWGLSQLDRWARQNGTTGDAVLNDLRKRAAGQGIIGRRKP